MDECVFSKVNSCRNQRKSLSDSTLQRVASIINASRIRDDGLYCHLEAEMAADPNVSIKFHRDCVSTYTSKHHLERLPKRSASADSSTREAKRQRRSEIPTFDFLRQCIFCGEMCELEKDNKNPSRWRRVVLCRTAERGEQKSFKNIVLETCDLRGDKLSNDIRLRVEGAVSDLHAADGRYHYDCRTKFMAPRAVQFSALSSSDVQESDHNDEAFYNVVNTINEDRMQIRNSIDIYELYTDFGGNVLSRRTLITDLSKHFGDELLLLRAAGCASILAFRSRAREVFKVVPSEDDDDIEIAISRLARHVQKELKSLPLNKDSYQCRINVDIAEEYASDTLLSFFSAVLPGVKDRKLPLLMMCNMITGMYAKFPTPLQVALGTLIKEKELIHVLSQFGVLCTYDEVRRFRRSAAQASKRLANRGLTPIAKSSTGLVQVIVDNFDANISSQNGLQSTHSLAMVLTQPGNKHDCLQHPETIRRIKKEEMVLQVEDDVKVYRSACAKKPAMPPGRAKKTVLSLKILAMQLLSERRARAKDFAFFTEIIGENLGPEWNGFNSRVAREEGHTMEPPSRCVYTPLIDMKPSDPDTMLTSMVEADRLTKQVGQDIIVFTCDQQLYKVAVNIVWAEPNRFTNIVLRLGGMHFLMSFIGCVGSLMAESGMADILACAFGGVEAMLAGKKYPQNFRALRLLVEEVLQNIIQEVCDEDDMMSCLESYAKNSRTAKLWLDGLIKPVFLMMLFCRAEKEADWPLHLRAVSLMIPYFFAAGHHNYARYGLYYLRSSQAMPDKICKQFLQGEHVTRHRAGNWNGMWTDMLIETTFMRYGKGPRGLIGITLKPKTMKTWALSLHICCRIQNDIRDMTQHETSMECLHKEEMKLRMLSDAKDRGKLRQKLEESINPLDSAHHPSDGILNIVNGRISPNEVNVDKALEIGESIMKQYELSWPNGFNAPISKKVKTMQLMKKHVNIGTVKVYDTNVIYSRIIGLQASGREVDLDDILKYELSPVPLAMFDSSGEMRVAKAKSTLTRQLQVESSMRNLDKDYNLIIDGSAMLGLQMEELKTI